MTTANQTKKQLTAIILITLLNACSSPDNASTAISPAESQPKKLFTPNEKFFSNSNQLKTIPLEQIKIIVQETFPIQVNVIIKGTLPNDCTTIEQITQEQKENLFIIKLLTQPPTHQICTAFKKPFEKIIALEVTGLKAGFYVVRANQISKIFELTIDN